MEPELTETGVRLAIEGCGHGTLHAIYASVEEACNRKGWPGVDLLIIGGDFQSVRNAYDFNCVSMPAKYRDMCDFHEYYSGQRTAPYLTVFVAGNHEASNYLFELYYGGWVAPNIYYMGAANVLRLGPLRIAGMSGIWKGYSYRKPHYERLPYNESDLRSIYHTREMDVRKLLQIRTQVDIGVSHDWPKGVEWKGNFKQLFRYKKHLEEDARNGQLGNVAAMQVMDRLRPRLWFSAHLHCKYAAVIEHGESLQKQPAQTNGGAPGNSMIDSGDGTITKNNDEVDLDLDDVDDGASADIAPQTVPKRLNTDKIDIELEDDLNGMALIAPGQGLDNVAIPVEPEAPINGPTLDADTARAALPASFNRPSKPASEPMEHPPGISNTTTRFLALDKCLPNKEFLQLTFVPTESAAESLRPLQLRYDGEWLAIVRAFAMHEPPVLGDADARVPPAKSQADYSELIDEQRGWIDTHLSDEDMVVPSNFSTSAPVYDGGNWNLPQYSLVEEHPNPQTARYCEMLGVSNHFDLSAEDRAARLAAGPKPDPEADRFAAGGRGRGGSGPGRGRGGFGRGRGRGGSRGRPRGC